MVGIKNLLARETLLLGFYQVPRFSRVFHDLDPFQFLFLKMLSERIPRSLLERS
jgi:hypothetical protein